MCVPGSTRLSVTAPTSSRQRPHEHERAEREHRLTGRSAAAEQASGREPAEEARQDTRPDHEPPGMPTGEHSDESGELDVAKAESPRPEPAQNEVRDGAQARASEVDRRASPSGLEAGARQLVMAAAATGGWRRRVL